MTYGEFPEKINAIIQVLVLVVLWVDFGMMISFSKQNNKKAVIGCGGMVVICYIILQTDIVIVRGLEVKGLAYVLTQIINDMNIILYIMLVFIIALVSIVLVRDNYKKSKVTVSAKSLKEAVDYLPTGLCCYYDDGFVLIKNDRMESLCNKITQTSLLNGTKFYDILKEKSDSMIVSTDEGERWMFSLSDADYQGEHLNVLTAIDVTEEYIMSESLRLEQEKARRTTLQYENYRQSIKELTIAKETLKAKIKIHDELGEALLMCKRYLVSKDGCHVNTVCDTLRQNAYFLFNEYPDKEQSPYEQVMKTAKNVGVNIVLEGQLPTGVNEAQIIAVAMHECITNTLRHAKGTVIKVACDLRENSDWLEITNDGMPPAKVIRETGGLAQLRKMIEDNEGTMRVSSEPEFKLEIMLPRNA